MDSDEEDVSDNEILQWYSERVEEIWDSATDSAFSDLSANLTDMFRQVMNNVKQRNQSAQVNGHAANGHSSEVNGASSTEEVSPTTSTNNVAMSTDQLMELLQDDEDWLDDETEQDGEEMMLSVQLTDANHSEQDQKNVKGVSRKDPKTVLPADSCFALRCLQLAFDIAVKAVKCVLVVLILAVLIYFTSLLCNPIQKTFLRHVQNYIYPTMRILRLWTLPLVQHFPWLTDWHEETCLIRNPLYLQRDIDCWSCQVSSVDLVDAACDISSEFSHKYYHSGSPLLIRSSANRVTVDDIGQLFVTNRRQFGQGIGTFSSTSSYRNMTDFLTRFEEPVFLGADSSGQVSWKINRVGTVRLFRRLFPRPQFIPRDTEVGLQKYCFVDGARTPPYKLPLTEFANVWIQQGTGSRQIRLIPSPSCRSHCPLLDVILHSGDVLYYNWQFWNPESWPVAGNEGTSLTYVGSFY